MVRPPGAGGEPGAPPEPPGANRRAAAVLPSPLAERFFALTPERVLQAVETRGQRATGFALALNSFENRVYEVELEDGERVVAKFYRPGRWSPAALAEEHAFLGQLAEEEVPVVAPLPLSPGGATLGELAVEGGAIHFALFPKVRGRPPEDLTSEQLAWLGRLLARIHLVGERAPAPARGLLDADSYGAASVALLREGGFVPAALAPAYFGLADRLVEACRQRLASRPAPPIRLHGDCHLGNLLWGARGPFFVDFDDFLCGPPVQDLWLLCPGHDDEAAAGREQLLAGYQALRAFDRGTLALIEPLRGLRILRYAAWIGQRSGDPAFARAFPDFREPAFWQREVTALAEQLTRVEQVEPADRTRG